MKFLLAILLSVNIYFIPVTLAAKHDFDESEAADLEQKLEQNTNDPFEKVNRKIFSFNQGIDKIIITPTAKVYEKGIPKFGRDRIHYFLQNLHEPVNFLNGILQLKPQKALTALSRFTINSFLGIGGINDVASAAGVVYEANGFDNTLKHYKFPTGPYIVLPLIGSSSPRGAVAFAADTYSDPFNIYAHREARYVRLGVEIIDNRSNLFPVTDFIDQTSTDKYAAYRSLYFQRVNKK